MEHYGIGFAAMLPSGANPTPIPFAILQDLNWKWSRKYTQLRGAGAYVEAVGGGEIDITGKVGSASIFAGALAQLLGATPTTGSVLPAVDEVATIPGTPYQVTVANAAQFVQEYSVLDNTAGIRLTRVASSPATGQYSVANGVFTFAAADTGHKVSITYTYTAAAAGKSIVLSQVPMNVVTGVQLVGFGPTRNGRSYGTKLLNVFFPSITFTPKTNDFLKQDLEFFAAKDSVSQDVGTVYTGE